MMKMSRILLSTTFLQLFFTYSTYYKPNKTDILAAMLCVILYKHYIYIIQYLLDKKIRFM
jgi:hypothetical protein